jgi:K+ transporter
MVNRGGRDVRSERTLAAVSSRPGHGLSQPALMLGAIGVVYGDIGTSPI